MRKIITTVFLCLGAYTMSAQVIVNSDEDARATLDVRADEADLTIADGVIPPRISRQQLISKTAYGADQTGVFVYVTDVSGVTDEVTEKITAAGLYFFDGTQWQDVKKYTTRSHNVALAGNTLTSTVDTESDTALVVNSVSNTVDGNTITTTVNGVEGSSAAIVNSIQLAVSGTTFTSSTNGQVTTGVTLPTVYNGSRSITSNRTVALGEHTLNFSSNPFSGSNHFSVDGNTFRVNALQNRVAIGVNSGVARLDLRTNPTSTWNPGSGYLAVGTTSLSASDAGAGAVRYNTSSGGQLQFSNGTDWSGVESDVEKSVVIAEKTSNQSIAMTVDPVIITNWSEDVDINGDFDPVEGAFTAPRTGNYLISFSFNFNSASINGNTQVEAILYSPLGTSYFKKAILSFPSSGTSEAGTTITFGVRMNEGEQYYPSVWHDTGNTKSLKVGNGFVNFSVVEL